VDATLTSGSSPSDHDDAMLDTRESKILAELDPPFEPRQGPPGPAPGTILYPSNWVARLSTAAAEVPGARADTSSPFGPRAACSPTPKLVVLRSSAPRTVWNGN